MRNWQVLNIGKEIDNPEKKRDFNERHFTEAASRYDIATRAMSLGRDSYWKRELVSVLPEAAAPLCVDLASGTGDIAFLLARRYLQGRVIGIDLTQDMVTLAQGRNRFENVSFTCGDMTETGLADASVDIVTGSYALRNAPDLARALGEVHRILMPGGQAAFLDFSRTGGSGARRAQYWLLKCWCGLWGTLLHGNPTIHAYIADSLLQFPPRADYHELVRRAGFDIVTSRLFYFGMLELLVLRKKVLETEEANS